MNNKPEEAGKLILTVPQDPAALVDLDQWWLERRLLARKLLDDNEPADCLRGRARCGATAARRLLPSTTTISPPAGSRCASCTIRRPPSPHFARISEGTDNPHALARGGYWQGRAAETMGARAGQGRYTNGRAIQRRLLRPVGARATRA